MISQYDKILGLEQRTQTSRKIEIIKYVKFETRRTGNLENV
jgi:hypothetical protein